MASVTLIHPEKKFTVPVLQATNKCSLFQNNPALLVAPYRVQSSVTLSVFQDFLSLLEGNAVKVNSIPGRKRWPSRAAPFERQYFQIALCSKI
jgi:hypothetical protein